MTPSGPPLAQSESFVAFIARRFSRRSLVMAVIVLTTYFTVGIRFPFLIDPTLKPDWLLFGVWSFMTLSMVWDVQPRRDLMLVVVGLCGGLVIEWWGTNTELWRYYTDERPPLWILPAWPIAALSIDRVATLFGRAVPALLWLGSAYWVVLPLFVVAMTRFAWPSIHQPASVVVVVLMLGVLLIQPRPDRDMVLFVAGVSLGIFLEYWGTSRRCWIYYTDQVPPPVAVVAHGFASVAFARGVQLIEALVSRPTSPGADASVPAGG